MNPTPDPLFGTTRPVVVLGLMSGTSMDGLDLCAVQFEQRSGKWKFEILAAETQAYAPTWCERLSSAFAKPPGDPALRTLDRDYGEHLGDVARGFCERHELDVDLVASHGHTIHHRPQEGYTLQVGNADAVARRVERQVVADFRSMDVALGGQGAPLVPIADRLLFEPYAQCVNLGGIANVSCELRARRMACDVTVCNQLLNQLAQRAGLAYDDGGRLAAAGTVAAGLKEAFVALPYHSYKAPKSLGREWFDATVWPLFVDTELSVPDALATAVAGVSTILAKALIDGPAGEILLTGGGAYNETLVARTQDHLPASHSLVLPKGQLIEYKEALAFALLGVLRVRGEANALSSVTGASRDSCGGRWVTV